MTLAGLDTLQQLVAKSLLVRREGAYAPNRLHMLETIRAYATERFGLSLDNEAVRGRHYRFYLALAERHGADRALFGDGGREHVARLDAEIDNLHAALAWAIGQVDAERALVMTAALGSYWVMGNHDADALSWIDKALNLPGADAHPALRVRGLGTKARCLWAAGRGGERAGVLAEAEAIARRLGDPVILSQTLQLRVAHENDTDRLDVADAQADEALYWAEAAGDEWEIAEASCEKAIAASNVADLRERVDVAARLLDKVGNPHQLARLLNDAAYGALCLGSAEDAADLAARATPIARRLGSRFDQMINHGNVGLAALLTGEIEAASLAFREELKLCREMVVRPIVFEGLRGLAAIAAVQGDTNRVATLLGAAAAHRYDAPPDRVETRLDETFFEPARTRLGTDKWNGAARDGGGFSFEDAIAYALDEPPAEIKPGDDRLPAQRR